MAVDVMIRRKINPGDQANKLVPLILKMRATALGQAGYISGETLCNVENPKECLVISRWESIDDWNRWVHSKERKTLEEKIETLTGEKSDYSVYAPMVPR